MTSIAADQAARLADCAAEDWPRLVQAAALAEARVLSGRRDDDAGHARWLLGQAYLAACRREGLLAAACLRQGLRASTAVPEVPVVLPLAA